MLNLFGDAVPEKSFEEKYREYLASPRWKQKRNQVLARAQNHCERCGISKWTAKLEVHHLTYERFMAELLEDLIALCPKCHKDADQEREKHVAREQRRRLEKARFEGWANKVFGDDWHDTHDPDLVHERYQHWRETLDE